MCFAAFIATWFTGAAGYGFYYAFYVEACFAVLFAGVLWLTSASLLRSKLPRLHRQLQMMMDADAAYAGLNPEPVEVQDIRLNAHWEVAFGDHWVVWFLLQWDYEKMWAGVAMLRLGDQYPELFDPDLALLVGEFV